MQIDRLFQIIYIQLNKRCMNDFQAYLPKPYKKRTSFVFCTAYFITIVRKINTQIANRLKIQEIQVGTKIALVYFDAKKSRLEGVI